MIRRADRHDSKSCHLGEEYLQEFEIPHHTPDMLLDGVKIILRFIDAALRQDTDSPFIEIIPNALLRCSRNQPAFGAT
jgi:hypothetical protein